MGDQTWSRCWLVWRISHGWMWPGCPLEHVAEESTRRYDDFTHRAFVQKLHLQIPQWQLSEDDWQSIPLGPGDMQEQAIVKYQQVLVSAYWQLVSQMISHRRDDREMTNGECQAWIQTGLALTPFCGHIMSTSLEWAVAWSLVGEWTTRTIFLQGHAVVLLMAMLWTALSSRVIWWPQRDERSYVLWILLRLTRSSWMKNLSFAHWVCSISMTHLHWSLKYEWW